jgi:DNA-binding NarL/FixJ family response regulator
MKLLIADDHALFIDALSHYIRKAEPGAEIVTGRDAEEALQLVEKHKDIDLTLLDVRMPGMKDLEGLKKLKERKPGMPVALISGTVEDSDIRQAVLLGARGYFPKTLSGQVMMAGIHRILAGDDFVAMDEKTGKFMPSYNTGGGAAAEGGNPFRLTPREREVLQFVARGVSNKEIARALELQIVTVKLHVRGICRKMNVQNRTQAAIKAKEAGVG